MRFMKGPSTILHKKSKGVKQDKQKDSIPNQFPWRRVLLISSCSSQSINCYGWKYTWRYIKSVERLSRIKWTKTKQKWSQRKNHQRIRCTEWANRSRSRSCHRNHQKKGWKNIPKLSSSNRLPTRGWTSRNLYFKLCFTWRITRTQESYFQN